MHISLDVSGHRNLVVDLDVLPELDEVTVILGADGTFVETPAPQPALKTVKSLHNVSYFKFPNYFVVS